MEYTIKKLAVIAGISTRTLRYYDEIGMLKPARINSSGYRIYGQKEVDCLQQILFFREMGVELLNIKEIIKAPSFNAISALLEHRDNLLAKRNQLDVLIENINKTIALKEGRIEMSDNEKFEGLKQKMIEDNEKKYGKEIREKYGNETIDKSNERFGNMSKVDFDKMKLLEEQVKETLAQAFNTGDPKGVLAQKAAELHKQWLMCSWAEYSKEAHAGLAQMYVADERFKQYYDEKKPGTAEFLRDAIIWFTTTK